MKEEKDIFEMKMKAESSRLKEEKESLEMKMKAEAARLYKLAASQGDVDAQYNLGVMHENGDGMPVNKAEAKRLYQLAAAKGDEDAQRALKRFK